MTRTEQNIIDTVTLVLTMAASEPDPLHAVRVQRHLRAAIQLTQQYEAVCRRRLRLVREHNLRMAADTRRNARAKADAQKRKAETIAGRPLARGHLDR